MTKKTDPFKAIRPQQEEVAVGAHALMLKTATLDQESRFLELIETLELHKLIGPIANLIEQAQNGDGTELFIKRIASAGPELWQAARVVLGKQFAPAVQSGCLALLDSHENMTRLVKYGILEGPVVDTGPDGEFLGCPETRKFIKSELTLLQGIRIIQKAWKLNGYGSLVGNLLAPLTAQE